jgi:hypothetical protein
MFIILEWFFKMFVFVPIGIPKISSTQDITGK